MSSEIYQKVYNFLTTSPLDHITAVSVIYQVIEDEPWISKEDSRTIVQNAINSSLNIYSKSALSQNKLLKILAQYDDAFEGVCSLRDIGAVKTNKEKPLSSEQIEKNLSELKSKLIQNSSPLYDELLNALGGVVVSDLSWKHPIASQVICDDSELVKNLPKKIKRAFMEPARKMIPTFLPTIIRETCEEFVSSYNERRMEILPEKLEHDRSWKEEEEILVEVTRRILGVLSDVWNNPAFGSEFIELQNEGTYVTNIIVPIIHAVLKDLPFGKSSYVSTSEKQSIASADRREEGYSGRRPDIMFVLKHGEYIYELIYAECSRLVCTERKKRNDSIKLWREVNDGIFWTRKGCYPDKDKFGIIGFQVAGCTLHLNVLIRDSGDIHRYYHLKSAEIPVQQAEEDVVTKFIETLLILRNILVVNMSLIFHAQVPRSRRRMEKSSTVSSDPE